MAFRLLVLHGPNMNLLGQGDIDRQLEARADELGVELHVAQSHHEGGLLEALHDASGEVDAVVVNPGVLAPQAWALAEGLRLVGLPAAEVLLSSLPAARGASALTGVVTAQVHGKGAQGYLEALALLVGERAATADTAKQEDEGETPSSSSRGRGKSIGRKAASASVVETSRGGKTIGRKAPSAEATPGSKSLGRSPAAQKPAQVDSSTLLTRARVKEQITRRLQGTLTPEVLAAWARDQWSALQRDVPCEAGAKETLDTVLLTLMAGAKAGDHVLVAQIAKLDR